MARSKDEQAKAAEFAFDFSDWHGGPKCAVVVVPHTGNGGALVVCTTCHCVSDLEAVGTRLTHEASKTPGVVT